MQNSKTANEIITELEKKYKNDSEALETIARRKKDIEYISRKEKAGGYQSQSALSMAKMLEADLEYWN